MTFYPVAPSAGTGAGSDTVRGRPMLLLLTSLAPIMFLPSAVHFSVDAVTSHAAGLGGTFALILILFARDLQISRIIPLFVSILLFLLVHLLIASSFHSTSLGRSIGSIILFGIMLLAALAMSETIFSLPDKVTDRVLSILRCIMVAVALLSFLEIQPPLTDNVVKPTFPFTEPSHYALVFLPLILHGCVRGSEWQRYMWLIVSFIIAYLLKNLSLVVGTSMIAIIVLPISRLIPSALLLATLVGSLDIDYFSERLDFSSQSQNISSLVYVQGWELTVSSLSSTSGWGVGFQQLGIAPFRSITADAIYRMTQMEYNLLDGGFISAKIVSEFGIFGVGIILAFLFTWVKAVRTLRKAALHKQRLGSGQIYSLSIIGAFLIDMFVRGAGYFTSSSMLLLSALFYQRYFSAKYPK